MGMLLVVASIAFFTWIFARQYYHDQAAEKESRADYHRNEEHERLTREKKAAEAAASEEYLRSIAAAETAHRAANVRSNYDDAVQTAAAYAEQQRAVSIAQAQADREKFLREYKDE
jgi:hypothetical protein